MGWPEKTFLVQRVLAKAFACEIFLLPILYNFYLPFARAVTKLGPNYVRGNGLKFVQNLSKSRPKHVGMKVFLCDLTIYICIFDTYTKFVIRNSRKFLKQFKFLLLTNSVCRDNGTAEGAGGGGAGQQRIYI